LGDVFMNGPTNAGAEAGNAAAEAPEPESNGPSDDDIAYIVNLILDWLFGLADTDDVECLGDCQNAAIALEQEGIMSWEEFSAAQNAHMEQQMIENRDANAAHWATNAAENGAAGIGIIGGATKAAKGGQIVDDVLRESDDVGKAVLKAPKPGSAGGAGTGRGFPKSVKDQARAESGNTCVFCGRQTTGKPGPRRSEIDHSIPKSRGGNNSIKNAQNTCRTCNRRKGTKTSEEFLE
jgi:hypothetical protein